MQIERRFAIVIGINDYDIKPLDCCVNDAKAVATILQERCKFNQGDIHLITSETASPLKDITGHFDNAIKNIEQELVAETDSVFFFFAGHGKFQFDNSGLKFHDSYMEIAKIFGLVNAMKPKYQCYVIDACESGGKVLTRGEEDSNDFITEFIAKSTGTLFMYAATENEKAKENSKLGHGLFTNYFLNAIKNDSLYDEGILTPNRIQDYIAKETLKESNFNQTPVIENRTIGYYPFAFNSNYTEPTTPIVEPEVLNRIEEVETEDGLSAISKQYFPEVPRDIRAKLFENLAPKMEAEFESWHKKFIPEGYEIFESKQFDIFPSDVEDKLKDGVVNNSVKEKVVSLDGVFSSERELIKPNPLIALGSMIDALLRKNEPEYRYYNHINWSSHNLLAKTVFFQSKGVTKVSCGVSYLIYQAIYGIGLIELTFYLDYNGFVNDKLKGPYTKVRAYKVNTETESNILQQINSGLTFFESKVDEWNKSRAKSISDFDQKSK